MAAALPPGGADDIISDSENDDVEGVEATEVEPNLDDDPDPAESGNGQEKNEESDCPICLQPCMHPVQLPCRHIFCYLCIKGVAVQGPSSCCAICRATIPRSVLTNPNPLLKDGGQLLKESKLEDGCQWYYESRSGGWWQYDERTMQELEKAYTSCQPTFQLLIAGLIYVIDFKKMIQYQKNNKTVSRKIKRGHNFKIRGVAGLFTEENDDDEQDDGLNGGTGSLPVAPQRPTRTRRRRRRNPPASDDS
ncbi:hypothetical protein Ocin01_00392 [Orchesella cincta]|uniref:E3 ubiquitin-protein ligase n=1 Tax=Orchesella cincta TaxID=48709 RepID=A0A1D2NLW2_ORCCI|nr:hypothetical protein Ocin01_00392 [Orchesella cincta]